MKRIKVICPDKVKIELKNDIVIRHFELEVKMPKEIKAISYLIIIISVTLAISGQLCLRRGMKDTDLELKTIVKEPVNYIKDVVLKPYIIIGLIFFVSSAAFWMIALSNVPLGVAYPFVSLTYIVILFYDSLFEHYHITPFNWIGVLAIVAGVVLVSAGRN